jgi:hypothetical protein
VCLSYSFITSMLETFMYVRNLARHLHRNRTPSLLFKLDIRKTFDSARWEWDYIFDILQRRGFPSRFQDWIAALLGTSLSRVLLNRVLGTSITHGQGLRQGDPQSPLLFVITIDPLQQILDLAMRHCHLHKIWGCGTIFRTSLYPDDTAVFMAPIKEDIQNLARTLHGFGEVMWLQSNFHKSLCLSGVGTWTWRTSSRGCLPYALPST